MSMALTLPARAYQVIVEKCPTGILVQQQERVVYINPAGADCLGYQDATAVIGQRLEALFEPASYATLEVNLRKYSPHDEQLFIGELRMRSRTGASIDAQVQHVALSLDGTDATMISFSDVTPAKKLEIELRNAQKLEAVGRLAAGIAHEINTPTQFVGDSIDFLGDSVAALRNEVGRYRQGVDRLAGTCEQAARLSEELRQASEDADIPFIEANAPRALVRATEGLSRISTIVGAMKEFAHADHDEKSPADLNHALQATLTIAHNEYKYVADVETELEDIPLVTCHIGDLNQVFLHLLVNAAHAIADVVGTTEKRGRIHIRTSRQGDMVRIDFEDTGCGIPNEIRHRIFDPFFTTKEVGRGAGQGLAIARSLVVDKHGGHITFDTEVNKGSTFTILLPISSAD
jgi:PAS domain S-box-containing protein